MATLFAATAPQAGSQHLGAAQQAGAGRRSARARGLQQQAGSSSRSRMAAGHLAFSSANRQRWHFGAHRNRKPPRSTWGLHSRPGHRPPERRAGRSASLGGLAAGRGAAALLAARMAAGQLGLQPLQEARTAALRHAAASRLTALGGFAAAGAQGAGAQALGGFAAGRGAAALLAAEDGSRPAWPSAARRGKDGSSSEHTPRYNRRPAHKPWGLRSTSGPHNSGGRTAARATKQIGPSTVGGGHDAQSEEGHRRQQKTTLHGSYSL